MYTIIIDNEHKAVLNFQMEAALLFIDNNLA
jgi:hypothetical protein